MRVDAELRALQEESGNGRLPQAYQHRLPFIHAKSFLFAIDAIRKALSTLAGMPLSQGAGRSALDQLLAALPDSAGVRDSTAHADERSIGRVRNRPLNPQPILNGGIHAPGGGVTVIGSLMGNRFCCTMADGELGCVEVSERSLVSAQTSIQALLNGLSWRHPRSAPPSAKPKILPTPAKRLVLAPPVAPLRAC